MIPELIGGSVRSAFSGWRPFAEWCLQIVLGVNRVPQNLQLIANTDFPVAQFRRRYAVRLANAD